MTAPRLRRLSLRRLMLAAALVPLALGMASCKKDAAGAAPAGSPLAKLAAPAGQKWEDMVQPTASGGMLLGNPAAPIKLIEYGSLSCPHCAQFARDSFQPLNTDFISTGRVSFEFRSFAIHPQDVPLTMLVRCAPKEKFFPLVEQVYINFDAMNAPLGDPAVQAKAQAATSLPATQRLSALSDALGFTSFFAARGITTDQAHACLNDTAKATAISTDAKKYSEAGIDQTPTFVINGAQLPADQSEWTKIAAALRTAGAR